MRVIAYSLHFSSEVVEAEVKVLDFVKGSVIFEVLNDTEKEVDSSSVSASSVVSISASVISVVSISASVVTVLLLPPLLVVFLGLVGLVGPLNY